MYTYYRVSPYLRRGIRGVLFYCHILKLERTLESLNNLVLYTLSQDTSRIEKTLERLISLSLFIL